MDEMLQILHPQGIAGLHGKALLCEAELGTSVSCAFTKSQLIICILQFVTELLTGFGCTAVAFLWPLENLEVANN